MMITQQRGGGSLAFFSNFNLGLVEGESRRSMMLDESYSQESKRNGVRLRSNAIESSIAE